MPGANVNGGGFNVGQRVGDEEDLEVVVGEEDCAVGAGV